MGIVAVHFCSVPQAVMRELVKDVLLLDNLGDKHVAI